MRITGRILLAVGLFGLTALSVAAEPAFELTFDATFDPTPSPPSPTGIIGKVRYATGNAAELGFGVSRTLGGPWGPAAGDVVAGVYGWGTRIYRDQDGLTASAEMIATVPVGLATGYLFGLSAASKVLFFTNGYSELFIGKFPRKLFSVVEDHAVHLGLTDSPSVWYTFSSGVRFQYLYKNEPGCPDWLSLESGVMRDLEIRNWERTDLQVYLQLGVSGPCY